MTATAPATAPTTLTLHYCPECGRQALREISNLHYVPETSGICTGKALTAAYTIAELRDPTDGKVGGQRLGGRSTATTARDLIEPKAGTQRAKVLNSLWRVAEPVFGARYERTPGRTDVELFHDTDLPLNSVRPRRVELCDAGWVRDSGVRRKHHGRDHVVWCLTDLALERLNGENS